MPHNRMAQMLMLLVKLGVVKPQPYPIGTYAESIGRMLLRRHGYLY